MLRQVSEIKDYHAHIYYDETSRDRAAQLRAAIESRFDVELGHWHDEPIGPHPVGSYQVKFANPRFAELVPWLLTHHDELSILIHPNTGDDLADHTAHALWVGRQLELRTAMFR